MNKAALHCSEWLGSKRTFVPGLRLWDANDVDVPLRAILSVSL